MIARSPTLWLLEQEARALLTRLERVKPFSLQMTSVLAAAVPPGAQTAIESHIALGKRRLRQMVVGFLRWLGSSGLRRFPAEAQRRFAVLKIRFNLMLAQFDIFADALVQRSEHEHGIWLGGLDVVAADALSLPPFYQSPPVICYLDRGHGAAIRRARTRLPGGEENPVAVIRVPRERMVGSGIASSLVHEVGHQAAALLNLVESLRPVLQALQSKGGRERLAWRAWERWISEIVADLWSLGRVGVAATTGLMGVVSLPRAFVFRVDLEDPHPFPWARVRLSCAMGKALFRHPQWDGLAKSWGELYPRVGLDAERQSFLDLLEETMPTLAALLVGHRPSLLRGQSIAEALDTKTIHPERLRNLHADWRLRPNGWPTARPMLAFAVMGQARLDGQLTPETESQLVGALLTHWAVRGTLDTSELCAAALRAGISAPQI